MFRLWRERLPEAIFWLVFSVAAYGLTFRFNVVNPSYRYGPAGWPRALLVGMIVSALAFLMSAEGEGEESVGIDPPEEAVSGRTWLLRAAIFGIPLLYVYLLGQVGFLIVTPVFLALYMLVLGVRGWFQLAGVTFLIYGVVLLIFVKLLFIPLPQGAGFFHALNGELLNYLE